MFFVVCSLPPLRSRQAAPCVRIPSPRCGSPRGGLQSVAGAGVSSLTLPPPLHLGRQAWPAGGWHAARPRVSQRRGKCCPNGYEREIRAAVHAVSTDQEHDGTINGRFFHIKLLASLAAPPEGTEA